MPPLGRDLAHGQPREVLLDQRCRPLRIHYAILGDLQALAEAAVTASASGMIEPLGWICPVDSTSRWEATLHTYAIRPIQQFAYSKGKNASDMAMVTDAMDLLYARSLDAFAIVSSDADFTPLVMRILTDGLRVNGFGEKKTPEPFVNACSQFTYVERLSQSTAVNGSAG